jgi:hypothetical protein
LGGTGGGQGQEGVPVLLEVELLEEDVEADDKLTKCVVSAEDWGLKTRP